MQQRYFGLFLSLFLVAGTASAAPAALDACVDCHGADGMGTDDPMIPVLAGTPAGHIEEAIYAYVDGARRCVHEPKMCETVAELSEEEVFGLANYYAAQERKPLGQDFDPALAERGAALHRQHCGGCHMPPHVKEAEFAIGIPLHGQRKQYLLYALEAYLAGDREALIPAMAHEISELQPGDDEALVNYYASYRAGE